MDMEEYYAKESESDRGTWMLHDITHKQNLKIQGTCEHRRKQKWGPNTEEQTVGTAGGEGKAEGQVRGRGD